MDPCVLYSQWGSIHVCQFACRRDLPCHCTCRKYFTDLDLEGMDSVARFRDPQKVYESTLYNSCGVQTSCVRLSIRTYTSTDIYGTSTHLKSVGLPHIYRHLWKIHTSTDICGTSTHLYRSTRRTHTMSDFSVNTTCDQLINPDTLPFPSRWSSLSVHHPPPNRNVTPGDSSTVGDIPTGTYLRNTSTN